ncbi:Trm112 family protein [Brucellaceae bacterium C25G]
MDKTQSQAEVDMSLLELLVCPLTKTALHFDRENNELISEKAKLAFPVRDGVPIMLPSEARSIE